MGNSKRNDIIYQPPHIMNDSNKCIYREVKQGLNLKKTFGIITLKQ